MNTTAIRREYVDLEEGVRRDGTAARSNYFAHIAKRAPEEAARHGARLVGTFGEAGITGDWPRALVLWEFADLAALARRAAAAIDETDGETRWRLEAESRWLSPAPYSPSFEMLRARRVTGSAFLQQTVQTPHRGAGEFLSRLERLWLPEMKRLGAELVGAWSAGLSGESEAISFWALRGFEHWAEIQNALRQPGLASIRAELDREVIERRENLFFPAPGTPLAAPA